jgi:hypothetical protein
MATIVNNPPPADRIVEVDRSSDTGGWVIAVIILLIVIIAGAFWYPVTAPTFRLIPARNRPQT